MPIPESQLETWAKQGPTGTQTTIYNSIQVALLESDSSVVKQRKPRVFLQGSYGNSTNIYADSDIDVVVLYSNSFWSDTSRLNELEKQAHRIAYPDAPYRWEHFHEEVITSLQKYYGASRVLTDGKVPKVTFDSSRPADIIVALDHRKFFSFSGPSDVEHRRVTGIQFLVPRDGNRVVVNFPEQHRDRGTEKHQNTKNVYKPIIRIFKNLRNRLVDDKVLQEGVAPSYFIECFLFNVANSAYSGVTYQEIVLKILSTLVNDRKNWAGYMCQNGQLSLFGNTKEQWSEEKAELFLYSVLQYWNKA